MINAAVFHPCNVQQAIDAFERLELKTQPRKAFVQTFSRESIMHEMAADILTVVEHEEP